MGSRKTTAGAARAENQSNDVSKSRSRRPSRSNSQRSQDSQQSSTSEQMPTWGRSATKLQQVQRRHYVSATTLWSMPFSAAGEPQNSATNMSKPLYAWLTGANIRAMHEAIRYLIQPNNPLFEGNSSIKLDRLFGKDTMPAENMAHSAHHVLNFIHYLCAMLKKRPSLIKNILAASLVQESNRTRDNRNAFLTENNFPRLLLFYLMQHPKEMDISTTSLFKILCPIMRTHFKQKATVEQHLADLNLAMIGLGGEKTKQLRTKATLDDLQPQTYEEANVAHLYMQSINGAIIHAVRAEANRIRTKHKHTGKADHIDTALDNMLTKAAEANLTQVMLLSKICVALQDKKSELGKAIRKRREGTIGYCLPKWFCTATSWKNVRQALKVADEAEKAQKQESAANVYGG